MAIDKNRLKRLEEILFGDADDLYYPDDPADDLEGGEVDPLEEEERDRLREEYHAPLQAVLRKLHPEWFADEPPPTSPEAQEGQ